jgi:hypothetical protein
MELFVDRILDFASQSSTKLHYLNAFNGSNFDHYLVMNVLINRGIFPKQFVLANGSVLKGVFKGICFYDVRKHVQGSLKHNLKQWKCDVQKGDFDHSKGCRWEEMPESDRKDCLEYLRGDVLGLREFTEKFGFSIERRFKVDLLKYLSTSQLTYEMWIHFLLRTFREAAIQVPAMEQEGLFREAIYGGRCYKSKHRFVSSQLDDYLDGSIAFGELDDYLVDMDVVSLYPAAMEKFKYPTGSITFAEKADLDRMNAAIISDRTLEDYGIFKIRYTTNKELAHAVLPRRETSGLKWDLDDGEGSYCTADINNALRFGYTVELLSGYTFESAHYIFRDYIRDLFKTKSECEKGTPEYILAKLFMNALYGKLHQRPVYNDIRWSKDAGEFYSFFKDHHIEEMEYIGDRLFLEGPPREETHLEDKISKPCQLAAFVLGYSRTIMLDYMERLNPNFRCAHKDVSSDFYYTDTDSLHVHNRFVGDDLMGSCLGELSNDIGDGKILRAFYISPKLYMLEYVIDDSKKLHYHFRGKGVPAEDLNEQLFAWMDSGKSVTTARDFQIKRIRIKRNSAQRHLDPFSLLHYSWEKTLRNINTKGWEGRFFIGNDSLPFITVY